jgi:hypothetical protein
MKEEKKGKTKNENNVNYKFFRVLVVQKNQKKTPLCPLLYFVLISFCITIILFHWYYFSKAIVKIKIEGKAILLRK